MKTNSTLTNWLTDPLRPKILLVLMLLSIGLYARQTGKTIAGQVVDETSKPLSGVTVKVKGTSLATSIGGLLKGPPKNSFLSFPVSRQVYSVYLLPENHPGNLKI